MEYPYVDWAAAVDYNTGAGDVDVRVIPTPPCIFHS
jgi:hypothetical protein